MVYDSSPGRPTSHIERLWNALWQPRTDPRETRSERNRERLRRQGLRPIQIWVPDVRSPAFKAEAHRQSLAVAQSQHEDEDQVFIDAISAGAAKES
jgi:hypothetical protein